MAELLGPSTIQQRALPAGIDGAKIAQWVLADSTTFQAFVNQLSLALGAVNAEFRSKWGGLFSITEELSLEYPDGGSVTELPEITDIDMPDMTRGETSGHMIDLKSYGGAVGGTWKYFQRSRRAQIDTDIRTIVNRGRWRFEKWLVTRLFTDIENAVGTGYDVPWVHGTGGNIDWAPPAYAGQSFTTSHDHFLGFDSGASKTLADVLDGLAATVEEHGHSAPFRAVVSRADVVTYQGLTKFIKYTAPMIAVIDRGGATTGNQFFVSGVPMVSDGIFGHFDSAYGIIELMASARVPTGYAALYKSYGELNARNPLKVRVDPSAGFGFYIVPEASGNEQWPVKKVILPLEFGVSVGEDRAIAAVGKLVAGGAWGNPTIS